MKKSWIAGLLLFVFILTMAGCSTARAIQSLDTIEDRAETKWDAAEEQPEHQLREAVRPAPAEPPATTAPEPAMPAVPETAPAPETIPETVPAPQAPSGNSNTSGKLTPEQAQKIALDHAGFTTDQVTRLRTEYEVDDGIPQFDVEFYQGDWEYEFEIHAESGKILSFDKDHKYD